MSDDAIPRDILQRLAACREDLARITAELDAHQRAQAAPNPLYHYTDGAGLLGILQTGRVRMTDIFGLNDPSELRHGMEFAATVLREQTIGAHPAVLKVTQHFGETMQTHLQRFAHFFVACFSQDGDDLGQWRAYGANGRGFAIGFDGPGLEKLFAAQRANNTTISINYDDNRLKDVTERMAGIVLPMYRLPLGRGLSGPVIRRFLTEASTGFSFELLRAALLFKHEAYKNEREYRFLQVRGRDDPLTDVQVRVRESALIRFVEFDWKTGISRLLRRIVIGPSAPAGEAREFVERCLELSGFARDSVQIVGSAIPCRG